MSYGDLAALESAAPVAIYEGAGDYRAAGRCINGEIPPDYVWQPVRLNERRGASVVTSGGPMGPYGMQFFWQIRATGTGPVHVEVRTNRNLIGNEVADKPVYDAIAACGFTKR